MNIIIPMPIFIHDTGKGIPWSELNMGVKICLIVMAVSAIVLVSVVVFEVCFPNRMKFINPEKVVCCSIAFMTFAFIVLGIVGSL